MSMWLTVEYFRSDLKTVSKMPFEIAGVSYVTLYLVTNYVNILEGFSLSLTMTDHGSLKRRSRYIFSVDMKKIKIAGV